MIHPLTSGFRGAKCMTKPHYFCLLNTFFMEPILYLHSLWGLPYKIDIFIWRVWYLNKNPSLVGVFAVQNGLILSLKAETAPAEKQKRC